MVLALKPRIYKSPQAVPGIVEGEADARSANTGGPKVRDRANAERPVGRDLLMATDLPRHVSGVTRGQRREQRMPKAILRGPSRISGLIAWCTAGNFPGSRGRQCGPGSTPAHSTQGESAQGRDDDLLNRFRLLRHAAPACPSGNKRESAHLDTVRALRTADASRDPVQLETMSFPPALRKRL